MKKVFEEPVVEVMVICDVITDQTTIDSDIGEM